MRFKSIEKIHQTWLILPPNHSFEAEVHLTKNVPGNLGLEVTPDCAGNICKLIVWVKKCSVLHKELDKSTPEKRFELCLQLYQAGVIAYQAKFKRT